jgi:hypothetical protein
MTSAIPGDFAGRSGAIPARRAGFAVALFGVPKGQPHTSPGQRPGNEAVVERNPSPERAEQSNGRRYLNSSSRTCSFSYTGMFRPFRARAFWEASTNPGRCPGLVCCGPFRAKSQTAQHQKAPARGGLLRGYERPRRSPRWRVGLVCSSPTRKLLFNTGLAGAGGLSSQSGEWPVGRRARSVLPNRCPPTSDSSGACPSQR